MSDIDYAAIRARLNAATEGPWNTDQRNLSHPAGYDVRADAADWKYVAQDGEGYQGAVIEKADAEFIAHSRTDLEQLLDRVEEQNAVLAAVQDLVDNPVYCDAGVRAYLLIVQLRAALAAVPAAGEETT